MFIRQRWNELLALFLAACASLLFEITTTKIFEFSVWANYAYLVISTAMFGLGFAGVVLTRWPGLLRKSEPAFLVGCALGAALTIFTGFLATNFIPIHLPDAPLGWPRELLNVAAVFLCLAAPFFFIGLIISFLFEHRGEQANVYYFFDLLGAGLGCVLLVPLIERLEPQGLVLLACLMALLAGVLFTLKGAARHPRGLALLRLLLVGAVAFAGWELPRITGQIPLQVHVEKRTFKADLERGRIAATGWSALSRVDISKSKGDSRTVWIAGGVNASAIQKFDGDFEKARAGKAALVKVAEQVLDYHALPHLSKSNHTAAVIGTSGGEDSLLTLCYGARHVTGIEMDPQIVRFVTRDFRDYAGGLFTDGDYSSIVVDEGRSYLRRCGRQFDVIQQVNNFTPIAFQNGALNLSEAYLLTVESFQDFYDHLSPDGILAISRYGSIRMLSLGVEMFRRRGVKPEEYAKHFFIGEGPNYVINTFMMKKSAFTPQEIDRLFAFYRAGSHGRSVLYAPYRTPDLPDLAHNLYYKMATAADPSRYWQLSCFDFSPTTDNRPFFNHFKRFGAKEPRDRWSIPDLPAEVREIEKRNLLDRRVPPGDLPPLIILLESLVLATVFFGVPLLSQASLRAGLRRHCRALGYFACLGIAFILIEICLIQKLLLFLGAPVYSLATVLACLLVSAGLGSLVSGRFAPTLANIRRLLLVVALACVGLYLVLPLLTHLFLGSSFAVRLLVSALLTSVAGFAMGMPMPTGIRYLKQDNAGIISWAWAMNGYFTVVGSALSVLIAVNLGFSAVFGLAALTYLLAPRFLTPRG